MNYKQKLGYMALGAGILALGIIIGQVITPDIEAQNNGVFDKITCRELEVIDKDIKTGITLTTHERGGLFALSGKGGSVDIGTTAVRGGFVSVSGKEGKSRVTISTTDPGGRVDVFNNQGTPAAIMSVDEYGGRITAVGKEGIAAGAVGGAVVMDFNVYGGRVGLVGKEGEVVAGMSTVGGGGHVDVFNNQGKIRATMRVFDYDNGDFSSWDRNGYRQ